MRNQTSLHHFFIIPNFRSVRNPGHFVEAQTSVQTFHWQFSAPTLSLFFLGWTINAPMLYGNQSISHYSRGNITIWMSMAFQAGLLNMGGFMACHRFVSHVTGFATFFGYEINQAESHSALGMLIVPLFFLFGCMVSGQLVDIRLKRNEHPRYYVAFGFIFLLICTVLGMGWLGYFGRFGEPLQFARDYTLLIILCLICGIQNGTITTVSKSVIRTTHLTGVTTDLGIGLVRILNKHRLPSDSKNEIQANLMRSGIIFFFGFGSVIGGFVFKKWEYLGFALPCLTSGLLFAAMLYFQVLRKAKHPKS